MSEKRGENLVKDLADFRPSISRKIRRKKFLTKNPRQIPGTVN